MSSLARFFFGRAQGPANTVLIRLAVGLIFLTQGILKYIDPAMGVIRFTKIGFPHPYFTAHLVGAVEIVCSSLVLLGLWTRPAALPLLIVISTAIATTNIARRLRWILHSDRC